MVQAMAAGDAGAALARFYDRFAGPAMALLQRVVGSRAEAEEILQDVFVELWRRAGEYDAARGAVSTWVMTVARSRALDALRARQRRGGGRQVPAEMVTLPAPAQDRPDELAVGRQRSEAVHEALAQLTDPQREALELSYFEGLSHSEIATRLGAPIGTVKSRISSAMKLLRGALARERGEP
jgi:RNA polymerase sigma-70 factor (ECF subfamily)